MQVIAVIAAAAEAKPARSAAISAKLEARHRRFQKVNAKAIFNAINGKAKPAVGTCPCHSCFVLSIARLFVAGPRYLDSQIGTKCQ